MKIIFKYFKKVELLDYNSNTNYLINFINLYYISVLWIKMS